MRDVPILAVDIPSLNEQSQNTRAEYHSTRGAGVCRYLLPSPLSPLPSPLCLDKN